jgi:hypothetical protein
MYLYLQYLEMRFSSYVRTYGAVMYMLQMILYTSVAVYAPALALSHGKCVSNHVNIWQREVIATPCCALCYVMLMASFIEFSTGTLLYVPDKLSSLMRN